MIDPEPLPPLPPGGLAVTEVNQAFSAGLAPNADGGHNVVLSVHLACGLFGFLLSTEMAEALGRQLVDMATAARIGIILPPVNGNAPTRATDN